MATVPAPIAEASAPIQTGDQQAFAPRNAPSPQGLAAQGNSSVASLMENPQPQGAKGARTSGWTNVSHESQGVDLMTTSVCFEPSDDESISRKAQTTPPPLNSTASHEGSLDPSAKKTIEQTTETQMPPTKPASSCSAPSKWARFVSWMRPLLTFALLGAMAIALFKGYKAWRAR